MELAEKRRRICFFVMMGSMFLIILGLGFLTPYIADDYSYFYSFATWEKIKGIPDILYSMASHYLTMNGRYLSHGVAQLFLWLGKPIFNFFNAAVYVFFSLVLYRFALSPKKWNVVLYGAILCALWLFMPAFGQTVLWLIGSCNYLWGATLILAWLLPFRKYCEKDVEHSRWFTVGFTIMGFMAGCYSENTSAAGLLAAGLCMLWLLIKKRKWKLWMVSGVIAGFLGWLTMILAPGNSIRRVNEGGADNTLLHTLRVRFINSTDMLCTQSFWLIVFFMVLVAFLIFQKKSKQTLFIGFSIFISGLAANYAMVAAPSYAERSAFGMQAFLIAAIIVLWGSMEADWFKVFSLSIVAYLSVSTAFSGIYAVNGIFSSYRAWSARLEHIQAEKEKGNLNIETYNIESESKYTVFYKLDDLTPEFDHWANRGVARYYELDSIVANEQIDFP